MPQLSDFLAQSGYRRIPLRRSEVGHFHAVANLRGRTLSVLIDTGADCTLVSLELARAMGLSLTMLADKGAGAGDAAMDVYSVDGDRLELAEVAIRPHLLLAMDLTHANEAMAAKGFEPLEAILGLDVFEEHAAIIDYGSQALFLRP
jgi:hypothetical protein